MDLDQWLKRIEEFVTELANDADLPKADAAEALEELADRASGALDAKREDNGDAGDR